MENSPQETKVTLRQQRISEGEKLSLYLDFYPPVAHPKTGRLTRRKFLGIHIWAKPKTKAEKAHNQEMLDKATLLRMEKERELQTAESLPLLARKQKLYDFCAEIASQKKGERARAYVCMLNYLRYFLQSQNSLEVSLEKLTLNLCKEFREFLVNTDVAFHSQKKVLSHNSRSLYFSAFKAVLHMAYELDLFQENFLNKLKAIALKETQREYLTLEELQGLAQTPCTNENLKVAALFSALTGLRFSDIEKLVWGEVREESGEYSLYFRQQKTQNTTIHPISRQAFQLLGDRQTDDVRVFPLLAYSASISRTITKWAMAAGIHKKITFHCFRHTFATLQLAAGTDLYTISKLLGHSNIQTTQIYAKVVDKSKREAVNRIKLNI